MGRVGCARLRGMALAVAALGWLGVVTPGVAAQEAGAPGSRALYQRYCAGCHGDLDEPARAPRNGAPNLRGLEGLHGSPLPRAALTHFVLDPRRTGRTRVCSERPLAWAAPGLGAWAMRRGMVVDVLRYLQTLQQTVEPSGTHPPSS